jgi:hypothetical protein
VKARKRTDTSVARIPENNDSSSTMTFETFFARRRLTALDSLAILLVVLQLLSLASVQNAAAFVNKRAPPFESVRAAASASLNQQNLAAAHPTAATCTILNQSTNNNDSNNGSWNGEVTSNPGGRIQGCSIQLAEGGSKTEWIIKIDGVQADLGRFSDAIYKKITNDAKRERFQGFRPGTIPPHLEPTYRAFAMDECARETVLEAMQQNNIRPFENARLEMKLEQFETPPPPIRQQRSKKKKKTSNKKKGSAVNDTNDDIPAESGVAAEEAVVAVPPAADDDTSPPFASWICYESMKEAIDAGWKPGQSFSFVAVNVKGQQVKDASVTEGARPLGGLSWNK